MRVAVITGGTSGIGLATARLLLEADALVAVIGRDSTKGSQVARELGERVY